MAAVQSWTLSIDASSICTFIFLRAKFDNISCYRVLCAKRSTDHQKSMQLLSRPDQFFRCNFWHCCCAAYDRKAPRVFVCFRILDMCGGVWQCLHEAELIAGLLQHCTAIVCLEMSLPLIIVSQTGSHHCALSSVTHTANTRQSWFRVAQQLQSHLCMN